MNNLLEIRNCKELYNKRRTLKFIVLQGKRTFDIWVNVLIVGDKRNTPSIEKKAL